MEQSPRPVGVKAFVIGLAVLFVALLGGNFGLSFISSEASNPFQLSGSLLQTKDGDAVRVELGSDTANPFQLSGSLLQTKDGDPVRVELSALDLVDGKLTARTEGRRLQAQPATSIGTSQAKQSANISAGHSAAWFDSLSELQIIPTGSAGSTMKLLINGHAFVNVTNSPCGKIVKLFTSLGGTATLVYDTLSFDAELSARLSAAGLQLQMAPGNHSTLNQPYELHGLFHHISAAAAAVPPAPCTITPPQDPGTQFTSQEQHYYPARSAASGKRADCESRYGGLVVGCGKAPSGIIAAAASKVLIPLPGGSARPGEIFSVKDVKIMRSDNWELEVHHMHNHPTQRMLYVYSKESGKSWTLQVSDDTSGNSWHCHLHQKYGIQAARAAEDAGAQPDYTFLGLVEEDGKYFRRFRADVPKSLTDSVAANQTNQINSAPHPDAFHEVWDEASSLQLNRTISPDGRISLVQSLQTGTTDDDIISELESFGLEETDITAWTTADDCNSFDTRDTEAPKMGHPQSDISIRAAKYYQRVIATRQPPARSVSKNDAKLFGQYYANATFVSAMADVCAQNCASELNSFKQIQDQDQSYFDADDGNGSSDTSSECTALWALRQCLARQVERQCNDAPFIHNHRLQFSRCRGTNGTRRLSSNSESTGAVTGIAAECLASTENTFVWAPVPMSFIQGGTPTPQDCLFFGCDCGDATTECIPGCSVTSPTDSATLQIILGAQPGTDGMIQVVAAGSVDISEMLGVPPPITGSVALTGTVTVGGGQDCPGQTYPSFNGNVNLAFALGIDVFGLYTWSGFSIGLTAGGGLTTWKNTTCHTVTIQGPPRRRWWTRRRTENECTSTSHCSTSVYGIFDVDANIDPIAGIEVYVESEYYFTEKAWASWVGVNAHTGMSFFRKNYNLFQHKI